MLGKSQKLISLVLCGLCVWIILPVCREGNSGRLVVLMSLLCEASQTFLQSAAMPCARHCLKKKSWWWRQARSLSSGSFYSRTLHTLLHCSFHRLLWVIIITTHHFYNRNIFKRGKGELIKGRCKSEFVKQLWAYLGQYCFYYTTMVVKKRPSTPFTTKST